MRVVFEVGRGADPEDAMDKLLTNTQMRSSLSHNALAVITSYSIHYTKLYDGETIKNHQNHNHKVEPGVYMYILDLGNGDLERGFVMVSY